MRNFSFHLLQKKCRPPSDTEGTAKGGSYDNSKKKNCIHSLKERPGIHPKGSPSINQKAAGIISKPAVSAKPQRRFMFCTAWPEAPFTILSSTEITWSIRPPSTTYTWMSQ